MSDPEPTYGPRFCVLVLRARGDTATRAAADEAATQLRGHSPEVVVAEALPDETPDGLLVVAAQTGDAAPVLAAAERLRGRAVALAVVADEPPEAAALAQRVRKGLRARGVFVLDRQVVVPRAAFGTYGLESEPHRDRLEALAALLHHDADRLLAKREGWLEPDELDAEEAAPRVEDDDVS